MPGVATPPCPPQSAAIASSNCVTTAPHESWQMIHKSNGRVQSTNCARSRQFSYI